MYTENITKLTRASVSKLQEINLYICKGNKTERESGDRVAHPRRAQTCELRAKRSVFFIL